MITAAPSSAGKNFETCIFATHSIKTSPKIRQDIPLAPWGREEFASEGIVTCEVEFEPLVCGMYVHFVCTHHAFRPNGRKATYNTEITRNG